MNWCVDLCAHFTGFGMLQNTTQGS